MNNPISVPSGKEKRYTITPELPEGLLINETSGEIYGKPLVKEMSLKEYIVSCYVEYDDLDDPYIYKSVVSIGITSIYIIDFILSKNIIDYVLPSRFFILNRKTSQLIEGDVIIFNFGENFDLEIVNIDGYIDHYEVYEGLPDIIKCNTSNNSLRIYGLGNEYIHDVVYIYLYFLY